MITTPKLLMNYCIVLTILGLTAETSLAEPSTNARLDQMVTNAEAIVAGASKNRNEAIMALDKKIRATLSDQEPASGKLEDRGVAYLIKLGLFSEALTKSKAILDEARVNNGIDPKSVKKEIIPVETKNYGGLYTTLGMSIKRFPIEVRNKVLEDIEKVKTPFYLDLLNMLKRVNLLYITAFHNVQKQRSHVLMKEVVDKIKRDLIALQSVPLYLKDKNSESLFLVFDDEVANEDQSFQFNLDLKAYLIANSEELGFAPGDLEYTIQTLVTEHRKKIIADFTASEDTSCRRYNYKEVNRAYDRRTEISTLIPERCWHRHLPLTKTKRNY